MNLLWTDICFLGMLVLGLTLLIKSLFREHTRDIFKHLFKRPLAVSSGIILLFFLIIGVLDSIHMQADMHDKNRDASASEIVSLLDKILAPLGDTYEKTYSAPLSLTLYSTEISFINGKAVQLYPRLKYPSDSIKNEENKIEIIKQVVLQALLVSLIIACLIGGNIIAFQALFKQGFTFNSSFSWGIVTLFICMFFLFASYALSRYFHLLGTGKIGQDIFYYAVKSIRTGLIIGTLTTLFMLPLAIILGIAAGYFGGFVDDIIQYIYTTLSSIPGVLLITASVLSMQTYIANHPLQFATLDKSADARLFALCLILGVTSWTSLCRLLRAETLKLREIDFVQAATALGSSSFRIINKHLLPNVKPIVIITLVLDFSYLVLAEAVLSYVGVGVSPMTISWGNMINSARLELAREPIVWWPMAAAFVFMFILVLASNVFADAVRDALDPHQSEN